MTRNIANIVVATDFSAVARRALQRAARLADRHGADLHLVHSIAAAGWIDDVVGVAPPSNPAELHAAVDSAMREECALLAPPLQSRVHSVTLEGPLHRTLPAWLAEHPAELVVLGAYGGSGWRQVLLGSTAERLLRQCKVPLLLVRNEVDGDYGRVLLATDFSAAAEDAAAFGVALTAPAHLFLVHADERLYEPHLAFIGVKTDIVEEYRRDRGIAAMQRLEASATRLGGGGHSLVPILRDAPPSRALTELADEIAADLVVVGSSGLGQVAREFLGSVSHHVATTLPCDVLVVS
jgi:nucleotide-binding universal stress UspA family protein